MSFKFFGQFLLERGKIIREELLDALEFQKQVNVRIGTIALDAGYLTADQIMQIQLEQQRTDQLFGKLAVEMKFMDEKDLEDLLVIQKGEHISLGEALVQKGYLTLEELETELREYKKSQQGVSDKILETVQEVATSIIPEIFLDVTTKSFIRLIDMRMQVMDSHNDRDRVTPGLWHTYQSFYGDSEGIFIMSVSESVVLRIASQLAEENCQVIDDLAKDGAKEFVNVIVGNSAAKLSQKSISISLKPPHISTSPSDLPLLGNQEVVSAKLGAAGFPTPEYFVQVSLLYSAIS